jgi:hypothetical protein
MACQLITVEFSKGKLFQNRAGRAQRLDRGVEHLLLLGLCARPFFETHDAEPCLVEGLDALIEIDRRTRGALHHAAGIRNPSQ